MVNLFFLKNCRQKADSYICKNKNKFWTHFFTTYSHGQKLFTFTKQVLEFVPFNLTECIFVFRTVVDFLFSELWNFPLFFGGKIQSLLNKKSMTVLKTKIHSVRLKGTNSSWFGQCKKEFIKKLIMFFSKCIVIYKLRQ